MDRDGYPKEEELKTLKDWKLDSWKSILSLLEYLEGIWWAADWGFKLSGKRILKLELHTGGWSGNEDIISELKKNVFWPMFWERSDRGGHYYFRIPTLKWESNKQEKGGKMGEPRKMMSEDKVKQEMERCKKKEKNMVPGQLPFLLCAARVQVLQDVLAGTWFFERREHIDRDIEPRKENKK